ncbi:hypothetical protein PNW85_09860 [[Ruminococcus] gnavus]|jgi:hypothetical protein|uniref:Uncharacterized protein n=1 Tax=Mediterraneibacter gnavus TaxID=33038 RepID=A0AAW6DK71_MEDGN|nr:hypothetical protein [Mediterraneibacter gnavus]MDB8686979.1 hypothetical protein [Mediterraneibacter gnavus]MDB8691175.1 hypothetical protein [Mediterraneibacter gnavus]
MVAAFYMDKSVVDLFEKRTIMILLQMRNLQLGVASEISIP